MTTSKSIAALIGPTLVAGAVAVLLNLGTWPVLVEQGFRDPALIFVSGFPLFVAGLAIVRAHNRWERGWPVLVTAVASRASIFSDMVVNPRISAKRTVMGCITPSSWDALPDASIRSATCGGR